MEERLQKRERGRRPTGLRSGLVLTLLLLVLLGTRGRAQKGNNSPDNLPDTAIYEYPVRTVTVRDGLSRNQLYRVWEDRRGFVWLAGKRGLDRFDGLEVIPFQSDSTMSSEVVKVMNEDREGNVLFLANDALFRYDGARFDREALHVGGRINHIRPVNDELLFSVSDGEDELYIRGGRPDTLLRIERRNESGRFRFSNPSYGGGVYVYTCTSGPDTLRYLPLSNHEEDKIIRIADSIYLLFSMLPWEPQRVIINDSLFALNKNVITFERSVIMDWMLPGHMWDSPSGPIFRSEKFVKLYGADFPLLYYSHDFMHAIHQRGDNLFIAAEEGLVIVRPASPVILFPTSRGMASDVWSVLAGAAAGAKSGEGAKFFFPFKGENIVKLEDGHYERVKSGIERQRHHYPGATRSTTGDFLIPSTYGNYRFDPVAGHFTLLDKNIGRATNDLYESGNRIYAATNGLAVYENDLLLRVYGDEDGLDVKSLYYLECIIPDREGRLWLGSHNGLAVRETDGSFRNYSAKVSIPAGIVHGATDRRGNLWFATHDGVAHYDYTDTVPHWVTPDFHEDTKFVHVIDSSWLLVGGTSKLYLLDLPKFYAGEIDIYPFDEDDGFPVVEPLQASVMEDEENIIWIGTTDGVVRLDPAKISLHKTPTEPHFHSFGCLDESGEKKTLTVIPFNENGQQSFTVNSTDQNIDIRFFTINHDKPHSMKFRYRLVGYRESWSPPTSVRSVNYGELPPGNYRFELQACLFGNCSSAKSLQLRVAPARFWEYPMVKAGAGSLLLLLFGTLTFQVYTRRRERQKAERQVRKFEMERMENRRKLTVHKIGPHFANNALTAISDLIIRRENEAARKYTSHFARLFRPVLEESLGLLWPLAEEMAFVQDYLELEELRFGKKLRYEVLIDPELEEEADDIFVPSLLIQSFVNNAVKHGIEPLTSGGLVRLTITPIAGDYLLATVSDNGPGIRTDDLEEGGTGISSAGVMLDYLNQYTATESTISFSDNAASGTGTVVLLRLYLHRQLID